MVVSAMAAVSGAFAPRFALGEDRPQGTDDHSIAEDYCENFSSIAADLRASRQKQELNRLKDEVDAKLREVQARSEELKELIRKRNEMLQLASDELLKIYSKMDPEAAARQLEKIDPETAASILRRLKPQLASEVLAVMEVKRASILVQMIARQNSNIQMEDRS